MPERMNENQDTFLVLQKIAEKNENNENKKLVVPKVERRIIQDPIYKTN
jgi:hypothetical protein